MEPHKCSGNMRGYIAMLVVVKAYRGAGIGAPLRVSVARGFPKRYWQFLFVFHQSPGRLDPCRHMWRSVAGATGEVAA